jgi:hypothetical protein
MSAIAKTTHTLASAVADEGTFTVSYPSGFTQATLTGATGGVVAVGENDIWDQADPGFAFSYGASNITVTNNTGASLPAATVLTISFGDSTKSGSYNPGMKVAGPAALTAATGTASDTIADVGASFSQTTLNNNIKSLADKLNAVIAALDSAGITR